MNPKFDVAVVGGGLAGLTAAVALLSAPATRPLNVVLIDWPLPDAQGALGGFAKFSGAKFSLPPAGMGLLPIAGNQPDRMLRAYRRALDLLGLPKTTAIPSFEADVEARDLALRKYDSLVLTPSELHDLTERLECRLKELRASVRRAMVTSISVSGTCLGIHYETETSRHSIEAKRVVVAAGRLGSTLLERAGAEAQPGKGIDLGLRVEFDNLDAVSALRKKGPDAKFLLRRSRTFCLNSPGAIFRYLDNGLSIAGGIVAEEEGARANFGLLTRVEDKEAALARLRSQIADIPPTVVINDGTPFGRQKTLLARLYGATVANELEQLAGALGAEGLVDWSQRHDLHLPLIDWHWPVYAIPDTFKTTIPGVYAIGDVSGHARGLLQAAVSGLLLAEQDLADVGEPVS